MKYWLSHLPLEVWVDVFRYPGKSRIELGRIVDRFGNRKFAEYLQFYLHDWGKRKLERMFFNQTPKPGNIKSFDYITIVHFDAQTINFLRHIGSLFTDVNLVLFNILPNDLANLRVILPNLVPLLAGINTLCCNLCALPTVEQCFGEEFTKIKILSISDSGYAKMDEALGQASVNVLMDWLTSSADNGPRLCKALMYEVFYEKIAFAIRQDFLAAKRPRTFVILINFDYFVPEQFHLRNSIGEELHGVQAGHKCFQLTRHPANCGTQLQEWIEMAKKMDVSEKCGKIEICEPTIGLLDPRMDVPE